MTIDPSNLFDPVVGHIPNYGLLRLNWGGPRMGQKTIFVAGVAPSEGAMVIARALEKLSIFVAPFPDGLHAQFAKTRGELSAEHGTWAVHAPFSAKNFKTAARQAPGPHYILVCEDAATLAAGIEAMEEMAPEGALAAAARATAEMALFAAETSDPTMVVSFQRALEFPAMHAEALALFLNLSSNPEALSAAADIIRQGVRGLHAPMGDDAPIQGALDPVQRKLAVRGWVKLPLSNERLRVRAVVAGEPAGEAEASELRPDLAKRNIGDGRHGFTIPLQNFLADEPKRVEVFVIPGDTLLGVAEISKSGAKILAPAD